MNLRNLDLNLLVALDALLIERNVTRAAQRLGLSQPTLSHSLGRLRRHFNDELLYRAGNNYQLTPLGEQLSRRTSVALDGVQRVFAQATPEPSESSRRFVIACSDYGAAVLGPALTEALEHAAPNATVHFQYPSTGPFVSATDALQDVDGLLLPRGFGSNAPHLDLFHDRWVCLASAHNAALGETLTMHDLATLPWVSTFSAMPRGMTVLRQLRRLGVEVRVQAVVNGFLAVPFFLTGTDRICLVPERIAQLLAGNHDLRVLACPFEATPLVQTLWWRRDLDSDAEHAWLRRLIAATVARDEMALAV